jgi:hypothetical protein
MNKCCYICDYYSEKISCGDAFNQSNGKCFDTPNGKSRLLLVNGADCCDHFIIAKLFKENGESFSLNDNEIASIADSDELSDLIEIKLYGPPIESFYGPIIRKDN